MTPAPRARRARPEQDPLTQSRLSEARYDSFVVRVLRRSTNDGYVHGQVTHVASRRSKRFTDLQAVVGFILAEIDGSWAESAVTDPPT